MDIVTSYTNAYLKETFELAKARLEKNPGNKIAQRRYNDLLAEMKRRGFIKYKEAGRGE